jgi:hypothetical protein
MTLRGEVDPTRVIKSSLCASVRFHTHNRGPERERWRPQSF